MSARWTRCLCVLLLLPGALTGCTEPPSLLPDHVDVPGPSAPAPYVEAGCPRDGVGLGAVIDGERSQAAVGVVPAGFTAVEALQCVLTGEPVSPGRLQVVERRSAVTDQLLVALALPDQEFAPLSEMACPAMAYPPTLLLLVDREGRAVDVRQPQDPCGEPRTEVTTAIETLVVTDVSTYTFDEGVG